MKYLQGNALAQEVGLVVVSPMRRTLQTAERALGWLMQRGVPAVARAEWQENTVNNIDIGRPVSELEQEFPTFDWSMMDPLFPAKEGLYEFSEAALTERGIAARKWLKDRKEKVVAVVSHDGFMRVGICGRKFGNADLRVFEFEQDGLGLVEWDETEKAGGALGTSPKGRFGWEPNDFKYMPENMNARILAESAK
jgi:broad specificity phosphatase PhoE